MEKLNLNSYHEIEKYFSKYSLNAELRGENGKIHELWIDGELKPFKVIENLCKSLGCERYLRVQIEENECVVEEKPVTQLKPKKRRR